MNSDVSKMILEKIMKIGEDVSSVKTTIEQHGTDIKAIKDDVLIIKSDNQGNYTRFIEEKEKIYLKVDPMWKEYEKRQLYSEENRTGLKKIFFSSLQWIIITVMGLLLAYHELKTK